MTNNNNKLRDELDMRIRCNVARNRADSPPEAETMFGFCKGGNA